MVCPLCKDANVMKEKLGCNASETIEGDLRANQRPRALKHDQIPWIRRFETAGLEESQKRDKVRGEDILDGSGLRSKWRGPLTCGGVEDDPAITLPIIARRGRKRLDRLKEISKANRVGRRDLVLLCVESK